MDEGKAMQVETMTESATSELESDRVECCCERRDCPTSGRQKSDRVKNFSSIASAVAAVASAVAVGLAVLFTYMQGKRDERLVTLRQIEQFESRISKLGHPMNCVEFLKSIPDDGSVEDLLSIPAKAIKVELSDAQRTNLAVCLDGLDIPSSVTFGKEKDVPDEESGKIPINAGLTASLQNFVIDFINTHDTLIRFSESGYADLEWLSPYMKDEIFSADPLAELIEVVCNRGGIPLGEYYTELVGKIDEHRGEKVCAS